LVPPKFEGPVPPVIVNQGAELLTVNNDVLEPGQMFVLLYGALGIFKLVAPEKVDRLNHTAVGACPPA